MGPLFFQVGSKRSCEQEQMLIGRRWLDVSVVGYHADGAIAARLWAYSTALRNIRSPGGSSASR